MGFLSEQIRIEKITNETNDLLLEEVEKSEDEFHILEE